MSRIWMSDVTHMWMSDVCVSYMCDVCVTWLIHICVTWLIHMCVWRDSFICVWRVCDVTHSYRHDTHLNESRHTYEWVMAHTWMSHVTHMNEWHHTFMNKSRHTYECLISHIHKPHVTHTHKQQQASHAPMYNFYDFYHPHGHLVKLRKDTCT